MEPKYPIYIISKGRADSRLTVKTLEEMGVQFYIVVEPQELVAYAKVINSKKILVLPFKNLGQGSIPARNWVWAHAKAAGAKRHWILDDNIRYFYRLHNNQKIRIKTGSVFRIIEEFVDRYTNVGMAGMQYDYLIPAIDKAQPLTLNTRIYSCILLSNELGSGIQWRGKYNEDTDLSLRILKNDWCTILFNAFMCGKVTTLTMAGGNMQSLYSTGDNRREFAESLKEQHPEQVSIVWKWDRWHHYVNYNEFKALRLNPKPGLKIKKGVDEFDLILVKI